MQGVQGLKGLKGELGLPGPDGPSGLQGMMMMLFRHNFLSSRSIIIDIFVSILLMKSSSNMTFA